MFIPISFCLLSDPASKSSPFSCSGNKNNTNNNKTINNNINHNIIRLIQTLSKKSLNRSYYEIKQKIQLI